MYVPELQGKIICWATNCFLQVSGVKASEAVACRDPLKRCRVGKQDISLREGCDSGRPGDVELMGCSF